MAARASGVSALKGSAQSTKTLCFSGLVKRPLRVEFGVHHVQEVEQLLVRVRR